MKTEIKEHPNWPVKGHRCDVTLYWKEGDNRPYQAHLVHYDEMNQIEHDELFTSKTGAIKRLSELWGEYNGKRSREN